LKTATGGEWECAFQLDKICCMIANSDLGDSSDSSEL
jgi:hypothetical protein